MERILVRGHHRSGTTVLCDVLRHKPELFVTYEMGTYDYPFIPGESNEQKIKRLLGSIDTHFIHKSMGLRSDLLNLKHEIEEKIHTYSSPIDYINILEEAIFQDKYRIIGDKFPTPFTEDRIQYLLNFNLEFKLIWIYRDGRDVVSSCYRHGGQGRPPKVGDTRPMWSCVDPKEGSVRWVKVMRAWSVLYNKYKDHIPMLELKYENLLKYPHMTAEELGQFIGIDPEPIYNNIKNRVSFDESHKGYYNEIIPHWEKQFVPEAIDLLKELKYI